MNQSVKKAPGPDRLTFRAIRLIWEWDSDRVVELIHACIRTGIFFFFFFLFYLYSHAPL